MLSTSGNDGPSRPASAKPGIAPIYTWGDWHSAFESALGKTDVYSLCFRNRLEPAGRHFANPIGYLARPEYFVSVPSTLTEPQHEQLGLRYKACEC